MQPAGEAAAPLQHRRHRTQADRPRRPPRRSGSSTERPRAHALRTKAPPPRSLGFFDRRQGAWAANAWIPRPGGLPRLHSARLPRSVQSPKILGDLRTPYSRVSKMKWGSWSLGKNLQPYKLQSAVKSYQAHGRIHGQPSIGNPSITLVLPLTRSSLSPNLLTLVFPHSSFT